MALIGRAFERNLERSRSSYKDKGSGNTNTIHIKGERTGLSLERERGRRWWKRERARNCLLKEREERRGTSLGSFISRLLILRPIAPLCGVMMLSGGPRGPHLVRQEKRPAQQKTGS